MLGCPGGHPGPACGFAISCACACWQVPAFAAPWPAAPPQPLSCTHPQTVAHSQSHSHIDKHTRTLISHAHMHTCPHTQSHTYILTLHKHMHSHYTHPHIPSHTCTLPYKDTHTHASPPPHAHLQGREPQPHPQAHSLPLAVLSPNWNLAQAASSSGIPFLSLSTRQSPTPPSDSIKQGLAHLPVSAEAFCLY